MTSTDLNSKIQSMTGKSSGTMNSIYNNLLDMVTCDSDCQNQKNIDDLRQKWENAKKTQKNAPQATLEAQKNYLIASEGVQGYHNTMFNYYSKVADELKDKSKSSNADFLKDMDNLISEYSLDEINIDKLKDLLQVRLKQNKSYKQKLDASNKIVQTNDRKVVYENWAKQGLTTTAIILYIIYAVIYIVFIVVTVKNPNFDFKNYKSYISIIIFLIIPFIIKYIALLIKYIYNNLNFYLDNKAPKNVFKNL